MVNTGVLPGDHPRPDRREIRKHEPMDTRTPLARLIEAARAPEKLSYQDIADLSTRRGVKMSKSNVSRLLGDNPLASVSGDNIRGLALALGISERRVALAAMASLGVNVADEETPLRQAILDAAEVGPKTKQLLLLLISADTDDEALGAMDVAPLPDSAFRSRSEVELAARNEDVHGQPIRSQGRADRRRQDEDATSSQDAGGMDPA